MSLRPSQTSTAPDAAQLVIPRVGMPSLPPLTDTSEETRDRLLETFAVRALVAQSRRVLAAKLPEARA